MPQPGEPGRPGAWARVLPDAIEFGPVPDLFSSDVAHLFDYCRALLGQDAEAIRTARAVLDSPRETLPDRDRLRAWLFGLARSLALALRPPGSEEPSYLPAALITALSQQLDNGVLRALLALTDRDREILDLVYRHGIRPADLPAVLIVPAKEVYRCLVNAEEEFISLAAGPEAGPGADLEDIAKLPLAALPLAALPLAALPATAGGERPLEDRPAPQLEGAAVRRPTARRRLLLASLGVIPVAAILGGIVFFAGLSRPAGFHGAGGIPAGGASQASQRAGTRGSPHAARSAHPGRSTAPGQSVRLGPPAAPTAVPEPVTSPSSQAAAGLAATVQPVPCPAGIKANFRWHYAATGSPGGAWSGPATIACPGSFTMGPQAMGNLQVAPGTTLQAGYDFNLPGNNKSLTMTVSAAQVTFVVSCVSKAAPSASIVTVPLQTETYQITNDQWYPSGDQASPLVYQGSATVPALCGPGGAISLAKGGTFTATVG